MRYKETGNVHLDFHRLLNRTVGYLRESYGPAFVDDVFRRMAHDVYRSLREDLMRGDPEALAEHWSYFLEREGGDFTIDRDNGAIRLTVRRCPAVAHVQSRGGRLDPDFCRATRVLNDALAEGSPFEVTTEVVGEGQCVQTIRRRQP